MSDDTQEAYDKAIREKEVADKVLQDEEEEYYATYGDAVHPAVLNFIDLVKTGEPLTISGTADAPTYLKIRQAHASLKEGSVSLDIFTLSTSDPNLKVSFVPTGMPPQFSALGNAIEYISWNIPCTFWAKEDNVGVIVIDGIGISVHLPHWKPPQWKILVEALNERNLGAGLSSPFPLGTEEENKALLPTEGRKQWELQTAPEVEVMLQANADGPKGRGWQNNKNARTRFYTSLVHKRHTVTMYAQDGEGESDLEEKTKELGMNGGLALNYTLALVAPKEPLPEGTTAAKRVSLDNIAETVYGLPQTTKERLERRAKVYEWLKTWERWEIRGERGEYTDPLTGEKMDTRIQSNTLRLASPEFPENKTLNLFGEDAPLSIEVILTSDFSRFLTDPILRLYLDGAELLCQIPGIKPSGALARAVGASLLSFWRRHPKLNIKPTRRELIERYTMEGISFEELLHKKDAGRALDYFYAAIKLLIEMGIVDASSGEAKLDKYNFTGGRPPQGWRDKWLDEVIDILPGQGRNLRLQLEERAKCLPKRKNKALGFQSKKRN